MRRDTHFLPAMLLALALLMLLTFSARAAAEPAVRAAADPFAISWSVLGGGGGKLTGGVYTLEGTVGQPVTGFTEPANKQVCAGFWCKVWLVSKTMLPYLSR